MKSFDKTQDLRIAIVHDYIKEYGGAERVLEALHEIWPDAPIFTTVYLPQFLGPHRERFRDWNIKTSFLQYIPFKEKLISPIRLIAPFVFKQFEFSKFDAVIVSATGAYNPNMIEKKSAKQICYCHTPPRYLYGYATAREWKKNLIFRILGEIANHFLRLVDFKSSQNVDFFIANSKNVADRIRKFYRKNSVVIYPPVEIDGGRWKIDNRNLKMEGRSSIYPQSSTLKNLSSTVNSLSSKNIYYLAGGRIARPKHIDLIVKTFEKLDMPLKVFGREFDGADLESKNKNIEFVGEVSDEEKMGLMKNAKAFVFAAEDEDFGITPVEAMSVGTPVIAFASGGALETVVEGQSGLFFEKLTVESLSERIQKFEKTKFDREAIIKHSQKFSKERFKKEILTYIATIT